MKIWIVAQYAQTSTARHQTLARKLAQRGHDVTVISSSISHFLHQDTVDWKRAEISKVESEGGIRLVLVRTIPYRGNNLARMLNMVIFAIHIWLGVGIKGLEKPEIVIGSNPQLFAVWAAERLAKRKKAHFVCEVLDLWPQTLVDLKVLPENNPVVWCLEKLECHLYRTAEIILTSLPRAIDYIVTKGIAEDKVVWIPMGVDFDIIPDPVPPKEQPKFTVMYAGSHGYANDLTSILEAASILKQEEANNLRFVFIGDGPEKPKLEKWAEEKGLTNTVFNPPVPRTEVYPAMQTADVLIVNLRDSPLYRYGISLNKLFDYLASARPIVIAADAPCNPVAESGAGRVVKPQDAPAMAEAVQELARLSPGERWEMGMRGRDYVEEHHDYEKIAARLEGILLGLAK